NVCDNCPMASNADQADANGNGVGDICDETHPRFCPTCCCEGEGCPDTDTCFDGGAENSDEDQFDDECDNCDFVKNPGQNDSDGDGIGDVCDEPPPPPPPVSDEGGSKAESPPLQEEACTAGGGVWKAMTGKCFGYRMNGSGCSLRHFLPSRQKNDGAKRY
ncbi:MAG: hypothetical protein Q7T11_05010, partial [Deltaproteobacteria bacterium]|nr:hypothetical protein [Deltaproteobacteria bacterium]